MKPSQKLVFYLVTLGVAATGFTYFYMKYLMENTDPFSAYHHPWQPWMIRAHVLLSPIFIFILGILYVTHVLKRRDSGIATGRKSGMWSIPIIILMVASGYFLQVSTHEALRQALVWTHVGASTLYLLLVVGHFLATFGFRSNTAPVVACALLLFSNAHAQVQRAWPVMGSVFSAQAWGTDIPATERALEAAGHIVSEVDRAASTYRSDSEVSKINRGSSGKSSYSLTPIMGELVRLTWKYTEETHGLVDPTVGPLIALWGFENVLAGEERKIPLQEDIARAMKAVGYKFVDLSDVGKTMNQLKDGMKLDFSAFAKGYALDRAAEHLQKHGVTSARLDLGGQLLFLGLPPEGGKWRVKLRNASDTFEMESGSVSTSANTERYFVHAGRKYGHIVDPRSGWPVSHDVDSVTVIAPSGIQADAWSTALFVAGEKAGQKMLKAHPEIRAIWKGNS